MLDGATMDGDTVVMGRITGLFGVRGWLKVHSYAEPREAILNYQCWRLKRGKDWQLHSLEEGKKHGKTVIARLAGVSDRDAATEYVGIDIGIARADLPPLADNEYYWADLVGLSVRQADGRVLGTVSHLLATGANDVLVVKGEEEILIPFVIDNVIKKVEIAAGVITVDWDWE